VQLCFSQCHWVLIGLAKRNVETVRLPMYADREVRCFRCFRFDRTILFAFRSAQRASISDTMVRDEAWSFALGPVGRMHFLRKHAHRCR
jgi:hypothetical protein